MIVRPFELSDLPMVLSRFMDMIYYFRYENLDYYNEDDNQVMAGALDYVLHRYNNGIILVDTENKGFLIGVIDNRPGFFAKTKIALIEYFFPISFKSRRLIDKFYDICREQNVALINLLVDIDLENLHLIYKREGFKRYQTVMQKEL